MNTNNLKYIREFYGATQDDIAKIVGVTRATISNWENKQTTISPIALEKLSLFFGISPEFFYEKGIEENETIKSMLISTANKQKEIEATGKNKADDFQNALESKTFKEHLLSYMTSTKLLLAKAEHAELKELELAKEVNEKLGTRLEMFIDIKKEEEGEVSLTDLYDEIEKISE